MKKEKFAQDIKLKLWESRINQARLSEATGINKATISRALLPDTGIDARTFLKICKHLQLNPTDYYE